MRYFKGSNYIEIDVDIGSSSIASHFVSVMRFVIAHIDYVEVYFPSVLSTSQSV